MEPASLEHATRLRRRVESADCPPELFRAALTQVPASERDAWVDHVLGLGDVPEDGPELPRGCVPYLPCPVGAIVDAIDHARLGPADVFVDIGSGVGRTAAVAHLLTGASAIGIEIQPRLVEASRALAARLGTDRLAVVHGDAVELTGRIAIGSVFFLYCPFSDARLERTVDALADVARTRTIRVCCVDVALPHRPWLRERARPAENVSVYVSG